MKKYIVLYYSPASAMAKMMEATPEEQEAGMAAWYAWNERCGDGMVDLGAPLGGGQSISDGGCGNVEMDPAVTGYSILQAENMDAAKALLDGHPHLGWEKDCRIEIFEAIPLG